MNSAPERYRLHVMPSSTRRPVDSGFRRNDELDFGGSIHVQNKEGGYAGTR